jgi:hypothetical protein
MRALSLRRMITVSGFVAAAGLVMGAGPVRIDAPVRGQVIDVDTKRPIHGAFVRLQREGWCPNFSHGGDRHPSPRGRRR